MFSPYQLAPTTANSFEIASNKDLASRLARMFRHPAAGGLWNIYTKRQEMAPSLKHTRMVAISKLDEIKNSTIESNQVLETSYTEFAMNTPVIQDTLLWIKNSLLATGASRVEFGRVFFSKHLVGTEIDLHVDDGKYFDYYDRFHFVVDSTPGNVFYIRDEPIELDLGKLYWVNNHVPHWLKNDSTTDRINLIFDARLT
jgi:Aspartyl/Asparaginyl beta-hydroxylase